MKKEIDVSYNPQLGYLKTVFTHNFDFLTEIQSYQQTADGLEIEVGTYQKKEALVVISPISDTAFRFRMYPYRNREEVFCNQVIDAGGYTDFKVTEEEKFICLNTGRLAVQLRKFPWEMNVLLDGKLLTKEQIQDSNVDNMCKYLPIGFDCDDNGNVIRVRETMYLYSDESFYGFGEKFTDFNKRGQKITTWQCDALGTNTEKSYKTHPYFMSSRGYSILLNTYTRNVFDMGNTSGVSYSMESEDSYLDYIMFCNRDYKGLLADYTAVSGRSPMIPKWAFGLWMSKCAYHSQAEVMEVVRRAKEEKLPLNVINIDGWMSMAGMGGWEWNREEFSNPEQMLADLKEEGIHLSLWMWPYISPRTKIYEFAREKGFLVKNREGEPITFSPIATNENEVACFDFTNPEMVSWYKEKAKEVLSLGVGAVKTDFSEAVPEDAVYWDGSNGIQGHNKLTFLYAKTIYEAMQEVKNETGERAMLWGRSGYVGSQKIPASWAGDSASHTNNHACILQAGLGYGLSGVSFWGFDLGGFYNTDHEGYECYPTDEEYIRSIQLGLLSPLSRLHGKTPREPWNYSPQVQKIFRKYTALRYRLAPYLYSTAYQTHMTGLPMMRALFLEYPDDPTVFQLGLQYLLGDSLLVAPVFDQDDLKVYLPEGNWADLWSGEFISGSRWIRPEVTLDDIPVYLRENGMLFLQSQDVERLDDEPFKELSLLVNLSDRAECHYYDDGVDACVTAVLNDGRAEFCTEMNFVEITVYTNQRLSSACVNGKEATINQKSDTVYEIAVK